VNSGRLTSRDLWLALSAGTTGVSLVFVVWAPVGWVTKIVVLGSGTLLALFYLVMWELSKKRSSHHHEEIAVLKETVLIEVGGSAEILFAPPAAVVNPKLVMTAHGHPVKVEDIWHTGISVISVPRSILYWHRGVKYSGHIDANQPLKVLLRNESHVPVSVQANIVIPLKE
jgi:hypothetical protein